MIGRQPSVHTHVYVFAIAFDADALRPKAVRFVAPVNEAPPMGSSLSFVPAEELGLHVSDGPHE